MRMNNTKAYIGTLSGYSRGNTNMTTEQRTDMAKAMLKKLKAMRDIQMARIGGA